MPAAHFWAARTGSAFHHPVRVIMALALMGPLLIFAAPVRNILDSQQPSLRNGRKGVAFTNHRLIEVNGGHELEQLDKNLTENVHLVPPHLHWVEAGKLTAIVPPLAWAEVQRLLVQHAFTVIHHDYQALLEKEKEDREKYPFVKGGMVNDTFYAAWRNLAEIDAHMDWLRESAPAELSINDVVIGETYEGRQIRGVTISSPRGPGSDPLPKIFINGCHHSGEWITAMGTVYFFEKLIQGYAIDPDVTRLVEGFEWILVPVVNVDGFEFAWGSDNFRTWRKTRSVHPANLEAWAACELVTPGNCEGCFGTDPNRNWDFQWATVGASDNPCSNSYHGPSAFSETEPYALATFVAEEQREGELRLYVDHHCCGDMYLQPFGALETLPVDHEEIDRLGNIGKVATDTACANGSSPGTSPSSCNYRQGPIWTTIYPASGSSVDYMYAVNDVVFSYGTEMRSSNGNGSPLPVLPGSEEMWAGMKAMALALLDQ